MRGLRALRSRLAEASGDPPPPSPSRARQRVELLDLDPARARLHDHDRAVQCPPCVDFCQALELDACESCSVGPHAGRRLALVYSQDIGTCCIARVEGDPAILPPAAQDDLARIA